MMRRGCTRRSKRRPQARASRWMTAALLIALFPVAIEAQAAGAIAPAPQESAQKAAGAADHAVKKAKKVTANGRRRAAKLYLQASKLYMDGKFEPALAEYEQAAALDPNNADYQAAAEVARSHAVTALIQAAAKDRFTGNTNGAQAALDRAWKLDPKNPEVAEHLYQLAGDVSRENSAPLYGAGAGDVGPAPTLLAAPGARSFHMRADRRRLITEVFREFGVTALIDESVHDDITRLDIDDADFYRTAQAVGLVTDTFYVPVDSHRVLVAQDTRENRTKFMREELETVYLPGLSSDELSDVGNLARNAFGIETVATDQSAGTLTLKAPPNSLKDFNAQMRDLLQGHDQVIVDLRLIQVAYTSTRTTGLQPPQSFSAFNVYAEEQSILSQNSSLVSEIISSGLASPGDALGILGILLASGEVSSSLFSNGIALFGGGLTESALSPGPATFNFGLNTSDSRALDDVQLRLGDNETGTIKEGTKYPIQTATFGSNTSGLPNIAGLTGAGASGALSSLLSSLSSAVPTVPIIQYQDLGLTLKVTPKVLRGGEVALTVDLKIDALSGQSLNGNPILNNQAFSGVVTLKQGEAAELVSQLNKSESLAISGTPGLSEVPGMTDVTDKNLQKSSSTLLIIMTPHVVRSTQPAGHSPAMIIEKTVTAQ